ncbi:hypothetical protein BRADI_5g13165v3 [Brachypodium distachyon]|uniref:Uncharacterized protein n=1 Tax=Brachypodium distachyon TaxID=15368 RepID=A0A0Q3KSK5_BRADI|nr:hypothetical protein BRADI_5g13165v3 [Brachypodium distachyon]
MILALNTNIQTQFFLLVFNAGTLAHGPATPSIMDAALLRRRTRQSGAYPTTIGGQISRDPKTTPGMKKRKALSMLTLAACQGITSMSLQEDAG